jgi:hypothetical protein
MRLALMGLVALLGLAFLASCGGDGTAGLSADQKAFVKSSQDKLDQLSTDAKKLLSDVRKTASIELTQLLDSMTQAMKAAEKSMEDLKAGGALTWDANKPKVEAALKDLGDKYKDAADRAKTERIN